MKNQPNEIFLNLGDDKDVLDSDFLELPSSEIGWSAEPIDKAVLRYVSDKLHAQMLMLEKAIKHMEESLQDVKTVLESNNPAICGTVWSSSGLPETLLDNVSYALEFYHEMMNAIKGINAPDQGVLFE